MGGRNHGGKRPGSGPKGFVALQARLAVLDPALTNRTGTMAVNKTAMARALLEVWPDDTARRDEIAMLWPRGPALPVSAVEKEIARLASDDDRSSKASQRLASLKKVGTAFMRHKKMLTCGKKAGPTSPLLSGDAGAQFGHQHAELITALPVHETPHHHCSRCHRPVDDDSATLPCPADRGTSCTPAGETCECRHVHCEGCGITASIGCDECGHRGTAGHCEECDRATRSRLYVVIVPIGTTNSTREDIMPVGWYCTTCDAARVA